MWIYTSVCVYHALDDLKSIAWTTFNLWNYKLYRGSLDWVFWEIVKKLLEIGFESSQQIFINIMTILKRQPISSSPTAHKCISRNADIISKQTTGTYSPQCPNLRGDNRNQKGDIKSSFRIPWRTPSPTHDREQYRQTPPTGASLKPLDPYERLWFRLVLNFIK